MIIRFLTVVFFISLFNLVYSQGTYSVKGTVVDRDGSQVPAGNILVLNKTDSTLINGSFFWDGAFDIEVNLIDSAILKIVALGYQDKWVLIKKPNKKHEIIIDPIQLDLINLKEVIVSAKKLPVFEQLGDRLVINVENSFLSNSSSLLEILKKTPRVLVSGDGSISVFGKGKALILIDGQQALSNEMLDAISPDDIQKIEIISNPSAKYEAAGKAIVNIVTHKNKLNGFQVLCRIALTQASYFQKYGAARIFYKNNKINLYGSYSTNPGRKEFYVDEYERIFKESVSLEQKIEKTKDFRQRYFYRFGVDYLLTTKSTLGVQYSGSFKQSIEKGINENFVKQEQSNLDLNTKTLTNLEAGLSSFNISYDLKPDSSARYFNVKLDHTMYDYFKNDDIEESFKNTTLSFLEKRNYGNSAIGITTLQSNYLQPFKNIELEAGIRYTKTTNKSDVIFDVFQNDRPIRIPERTNKYQYDEQLAASYILFKKKINQWSIDGGIRFEHTFANGFSENENTEIVDNNYINLFPSLNIRYDFSKDLNITASYSKRIKRPKIQELDPFVFYLDSLSYYQGNPLLEPAITHSSELSVTYMEYASISTGYSRTTNPMFLFVEQESENSLISIASIKNLKKSAKYFATLNLPYQWKGWTTYNVVGVEFNEFDYQINEQNYNLSKPLWYFFFHNDFKLPKHLSFQVSYLYTTSGANGVFEFQPKSNLSFSINKFFFNKKVQVTLSANDLLNKDRLRSSTILGDLQLAYNSFYDNRYVRLDLRYRFGKLKSKYKDKISNKEELKRIKQ